ncbi:MAG: hypothetical protein M3O25_11660, partial [Actinomycetota bacterium]|nr:hypothetical protein [Actinomycetota bacterium]
AGTAASVTSEPANLPSDCSNSPGGGPLAPQTAELLICLDSPQTPGGVCPWFTTPPKPSP